MAAASVCLIEHCAIDAVHSVNTMTPILNRGQSLVQTIILQRAVMSDGCPRLLQWILSSRTGSTEQSRIIRIVKRRWEKHIFVITERVAFNIDLTVSSRQEQVLHEPELKEVVALADAAAIFGIAKQLALASSCPDGHHGRAGRVRSREWQRQGVRRGRRWLLLLA